MSLHAFAMIDLCMLIFIYLNVNSVELLRKWGRTNMEGMIVRLVGLALNCSVNKHNTFARKNYYYCPGACKQRQLGGAFLCCGRQ